MNCVVAGDGDGTVARQIADIGAVDICRDAANGRMQRPDWAAVFLQRVDDFAFAARGDRDDDVLLAGALKTALNVGFCRDSARAREDENCCNSEQKHTAGNDHGLYYIKVSAKDLTVILLTYKSFEPSYTDERLTY